MTSSPPRPIVLDCDPGHDDAFAILLSLGDARVELRGVTTVAGNQTLEKTTRNACVVLTTAGALDVPVVAGCARPLLRQLRTAPDFHGDSGMDGPEPVEPAVAPRSGHAADFIAETVLRSPGEVTVVATGPLTNLALAVRRYPELAGAVREVVLMGGSYSRGNTTPAAEFNILVDPESAAIVFGERWPLTMIGLDVTHQATCSPGTQQTIEAIGGSIGSFAGGLLRYFRSAYRAAADMEDPPLHDACAVAFVADRSIFESRRASIEVETSGAWTAGMTVVDFLRDGAGGPVTTTQVATGIDRERFWTTMTASLAELAGERAGGPSAART